MIEVLQDRAALARRLADVIAARAAASTGPFSIALSGGATPKALYALLAQSPWRERMPWDRVQLYWGDERFVPPDHPDSNHRMAREALIDHVPIPSENVHPIPADGTPADAAARYAAILPARFDIVLLGLGPDGHTASLFPGDPALAETARDVVAVTGARPEARISLTYPALARSEAVFFMVEGAGKREAVRRVLAGDPALPAAAVRSEGETRWFLDRAAAPVPHGTIAVVMGVSASGKTTIAQALAQRLGWPFLEGDDLHPRANRRKMAAGIPLDDADRAPWLDAIAVWIEGQSAAGLPGIIACSALRRDYREKLAGGRPWVRIIHLDVPRHELEARLAKRQGHFMPASLLDSQLSTLEAPAATENAIVIDGARPIGTIVRNILRLL